MNDQADVGLIAACQQGDARAFRKVFDIYRDRIYALCRHMSGNAEDAEDLCQEAFVSAFRNIGTYRADAAFGTWLYRIAANRCTAELRKRTPKFRSFNAANETELSCMEKRHRAGQALMATAGVGGGLFGGVGFLLGLMSEHTPGSGGIRTAIIPLLWGFIVGGVCYALRGTLQQRTAMEVQQRRMAMMSVFEIQHGTHPVMLRWALTRLVAPRLRSGCLKSNQTSA